MFSKYFNSNLNPTTIQDFLHSTHGDQWNYLQALNLKKSDFEEATFDQLLNNPADVADGVNKVEMKFDALFFNLFDRLFIKHQDDNSIQLQFVTQTTDSKKILFFFSILMHNLDGGFVEDQKFSSFNHHHKVENLAKGKFEDQSEEVYHVWLKGRFTFRLQYKIKPLHQLVFSVNLSPPKLPDQVIRTKGTLLNKLQHNIQEVMTSNPVKTAPTYLSELNGGEIKFVDYTFDLDPPEFGIFEQVKVRIFDKEKHIEENIQTHLTYFSKFEIDTSATIKFCDEISGIYGKDSHGDIELMPYELDILDESEFWTGRSWLFNTAHSIQDLNDKDQNMLYKVTLSSNPKEDGLNLHIQCFNKMIDYQNLMMP